MGAVGGATGWVWAFHMLLVAISVAGASATGPADMSPSFGAFNRSLAEDTSKEPALVGRVPEKPVFFLHFHKAGGTTVNFLLSQKKRKWTPNVNGNPWESDRSKLVKFWNYDASQFDSFQKQLRANHVQYVAFEWNYFRHFDALDLSGIDLVTCIRDPYDRFVSNYFARGSNKPITPTAWLADNVEWRRPKSKDHFFVSDNKANYYTRMLCGLADKPQTVLNDSHLAIAKANLAHFRSILVLENTESFELLKEFGLASVTAKKNVHNKAPGTKTLASPPSRAEFEALNKLDYQLYQHAKQLSTEMVLNHSAKSNGTPSFLPFFLPSKANKMVNKHAVGSYIG